MSRLVTMEPLGMVPGHVLETVVRQTRGARRAGGPAAVRLGLVLAAGVASGVRSTGYGVVVWAEEAPGGGDTASWAGRRPVDEHVAVDVDGGVEAVRLDCADVLYGTLPRPLGSAERTAAALARAHVGALLVALPLAGGGWAVAARSGEAGPVGPGPVVVCRTYPRAHRAAVAQHPLLPSCLHGWLVTGHDVTELGSVELESRC